MYAIKAIYDGVNFKPKEKIPFTDEYEVIITFTTPLKTIENTPRHFSEAEKNEITKALFGVLPSNVDLNEARDERLQ